MQNYPPSGDAPNYSPSGMPQGQTPKSKKPWIIGGIVGCLLLIIIAVAALGGLAYLGYRVADKAEKVARTINTNGRALPPLPDANTRQYVNTRAGRSGKLAENFVDFSFYYPDNWKLNDDDPELNFVRVERDVVEAGENYPQEKFAVGWVSATGTARDKQLLPKLAAQFSKQLASQYPNYKKVSEGETRIGPYEGYEFRFTTSNNNDEFWGRVVLLPPTSAGHTKGVALMMFGSNRAPGLTGVADVGEKGELPVILNSFRFGADASK